MFKFDLNITTSAHDLWRIVSFQVASTVWLSASNVNIFRLSNSNFLNKISMHDFWHIRCICNMILNGWVTKFLEIKVNNEIMERNLNTAIVHTDFLIHKRKFILSFKILMIFHYAFSVSLKYSFIPYEVPSNRGFILSLFVII